MDNVQRNIYLVGSPLLETFVEKSVVFRLVWFLLCTYRATKIKRLKFLNRRWSKRSAGVIILVIRNLCLFSGVSLSPFDHSYLCQIPIKQGHQYICLSWRTLVLITFPNRVSCFDREAKVNSARSESGSVRVASSAVCHWC
jgi:hypothetical protein